MVNVMNFCQGTGFDQSLMHGDCGDGDAMNCFQGAEFEWVRGDALCTLATCGDCGDDDAINYFRGTELEQGVMRTCYMWWLWWWWCNQLLLGHRVRAGGDAHLLYVVIVVMVMYWTVFRAQSLSGGNAPCAHAMCGDGDATNCFQGAEFEQGAVSLAH